MVEKSKILNVCYLTFILTLLFLWVSIPISAKPGIKETEQVSRELLTLLDRSLDGKQLLKVSVGQIYDLDSCGTSAFSEGLRSNLFEKINRSVFLMIPGNRSVLNGYYTKNGEEISVLVEISDVKTGREITTAELSFTFETIPADLFRITGSSYPQNLSNCVLSRFLKNSNEDKPRVSIAGIRYNGMNINTPFSGLLRNAFYETISNSDRVINDEKGKHIEIDYRKGNRLLINVKITDQFGSENYYGLNLSTDADIFDEDLFDLNLGNYIHGIVEELSGQIILEKPVKLAVHDITYQDSRLGTPLGRYLSDLVKTHLTMHPDFLVIDYGETRKIAGTVNARGLKKNLKGSDEITGQIGADGFLKGNYWDMASQSSRFTISVYSAGNQILASHSTEIPLSLLPASLERLPKRKQQIVEQPVSVQEQAAPVKSPPVPVGKEVRPAISLKTNRGEEAIYYGGESFSIFFSVNQPWFARIYYIQSDGTILEIFPDIDGAEGKLETDKIYSIPDSSTHIQYEVTEPFGFEEVHAFVSKEPLPFPGEIGESEFREFSGSIEDLEKELRSAGSLTDREFLHESIMITTIPGE